MSDFQDYTISHIVGPNAQLGLYPIKNTNMVYFSESGAGGSNADDAIETLELGFSFPFESMSYPRITVCTNGWAVLHSGTFTESDILTTTTWTNADIKSVFTKNHLLCSVWHDDLRNVFRYLTSTGAPTYVTGTSFQGLARPVGTVELIQNGLHDYPAGIDSTTGGMKYAKLDSDKGKCVVVRWKSFAYYSPYKNIVNFDLVIYESGEIEYRYGPRIVYGTEVKESATIAIFAYDGPRFRDIGGYLKKTLQNDSPVGGKIYTAGFQDSDTAYSPAMTSSYVNSLNTTDNWPGLSEYGAIFRISPPVPMKKFNKSDVQRRQNNSFNRSGLFDDQKTINFISGTISYPSMMPISSRLNNVGGNSKCMSHLFSSGSIKVIRNITPALFEQVLEDSINEGNL